METEVYLIRHGETRWNRERRVQGHWDEPLSPQGKEQARRLGEFLRDIPFDVIYSSDLARAAQTAACVAADRGLDVHQLPSLRERNLGEWEGLLIDEVIQRHPEHWRTIWHQGGQYGVEKVEETTRRMTDTLGKLVRHHPDQRIAVVSHGGSINAFLAVASDGQYGPGRSRIGNTGICRLRYSDTEGWQVEAINQVDHLLSPKPQADGTR